MRDVRTILHVFSTFAVGGPQARFARIANAFGGRYRHEILAMDGDYAARERLGPQVDVRLRDDIAPKKRRTVRNILRFRRILAAERPDLLVTYNWGAIEWAMANRPAITPHIHVEDGFGPDEAAGQLQRRVLFRRVALAKTDIVVASRTLEKIAAKTWGIPPERIRFIANGVDAERFARAPNPSFAMVAGAPSAGPLIGTLAALRPEKNLVRMVEAFALVNAQAPARLAIVGDGPDRIAIAAAAETQGVAARVALAGPVDDAASIIGAFDLFMMSSDTEQAPVSLLEAMAAGLAVVATDVGDIAMMVSDENRPFIVSPDAKALAGAAAALLADTSLRRRIGAANRAKCAAEFSEARMVEDWKRLWDGDDGDRPPPSSITREDHPA